MEAIDVFYPVRGRAYPWNGDVVSLVERAQEQFDEGSQKNPKKELLKMSLVLMILSQIQASEENG
jgi:signal recognition particle GTPase